MRAVVGARAPQPTLTPPLRRHAVSRAALLVVVAALVLGLRGSLSDYNVGIMVTTLIYIGVAISWDVIGGIGGLFAFGTAGFFGLGAYAAAIGQEHHLPLAAGLLLAVCAAALGGTIAIPALRARGMYFAILTLAIASAASALAARYAPGGATGILYSAYLPTDPMVTDLALAGVIGAGAIYAVIEATGLGVKLRLCRLDVEAARSIGVDPRFVTSGAFVISAAMAGYFGAVYALTLGFMDPTTAFNVQWSTIPVLACILGGAGSLAGAIVGATAYSLVIAWITTLGASAGQTDIVTGGILILLILLAPRGVLGLLEQLRSLAGTRWSWFAEVDPPDAAAAEPAHVGESKSGEVVR